MEEKKVYLDFQIFDLCSKQASVTMAFVRLYTKLTGV